MDEQNTASKVYWLSYLFLSAVIFLISFFNGNGFGPSVAAGLMCSGLIFWYFTKKFKEWALEEELEKDKVKKEEETRARRDADVQTTPYRYIIGRHAHETLALRYGLANSHGDKENKSINLRKRKSIKKDFYEGELTDFGHRKAVAFIEKGTDYVKTFYPLSERWFVQHRTLEELLKNNRGIKLSDIAKYHIDAKLEQSQQK